MRLPALATGLAAVSTLGISNGCGGNFRFTGGGKSQRGGRTGEGGCKAVLASEGLGLALRITAGGVGGGVDDLDAVRLWLTIGILRLTGDDDLMCCTPGDDDLARWPALCEAKLSTAHNLGLYTSELGDEQREPPRESTAGVTILYLPGMRPAAGLFTVRLFAGRLLDLPGCVTDCLPIRPGGVDT